MGWVDQEICGACFVLLSDCQVALYHPPVKGHVGADAGVERHHELAVGLTLNEQHLVFGGAGGSEVHQAVSLGSCGADLVLSFVGLEHGCTRAGVELSGLILIR